MMKTFFFIIGLIFVVPIVIGIIFFISSYIKPIIDCQTKSKDSGWVGWVFAIIIAILLLFLVGLCSDDNDDDYTPEPRYRHTYNLTRPGNSIIHSENTCFA